MSLSLCPPVSEDGEVEETPLGDLEASLARQTRRYHNLFHLPATALLETDTQGRILAANAAAGLLFAMPPQCLCDGVLSAIVDRPDCRRFLDLLRNIRCGEAAVRAVLAMRKRRAGPFAAELRGVSHDGQNGPAVLWSVRETCPALPTPTSQADLERLVDERVAIKVAELLRDNRLLRQANDELRTASEAKERLLASLVHELRTPLMPVMFAASMMEGENPPPQQVRQAAELIRRNVEIEARLIDDLFDTGLTARGNPKLNPEEVDLHRLLDEVVVFCQSDIRARQVDLRIELESPRHVVRGDSVMLRQLFWSLLRDALRSTRSQCALAIRSRELSGDRISIAVEIDGAPVFCPNLAVARPLIEAHGGAFVAERDERAATVFVYLPLLDGEQRAGLPPASLVRRRILLVDDHEDSAATLARFLRRHGQHVAVAHCAADALRLARHHRFDVLICDLLLPDASGYELLPRLRGFSPLAAVAVSALGSAHDFERSEQAGFLRHLVKPVIPSQLLAVLAGLEPVLPVRRPS